MWTAKADIQTDKWTDSIPLGAKVKNISGTKTNVNRPKNINILSRTNIILVRLKVIFVQLKIIVRLKIILVPIILFFSH